MSKGQKTALIILAYLGAFWFFIERSKRAIGFVAGVVLFFILMGMLYLMR
jgi:uncharacterized membrane protein (GlpM family)